MASRRHLAGRCRCLGDMHGEVQPERGPFQRTNALMRAHSAALDTVVMAIARMHWSSR